MLELVDLLLLGYSLELNLFFLGFKSDDLFLMILKCLLAFEELFVPPLPVLDLVLYLLVEAVDDQLLLGLLLLELLDTELRLLLEFLAEIFLDLGALVLILIVRGDQNLNISVHLIILFVEARVLLHQRAYIFLTQLSLAGRRLRALLHLLHSLPPFLHLLKLFHHFPKLVLPID